MTEQDYRYHKRWKLDRLRGIKRLTDPTPARIHIESLMMAGASLRSIADAAGVSASTISGITRDRGQQIKATVSAGVLAVTLDDTMSRKAGEDFVLKVGAVRRIQALMALGHRAQDIAAAGGMRVCDVHNTVNQHGRWISHARHVAIKGAYTALSMTPGPSANVRGRSAAKGWLPPLAWDDEDMDDPNAEPSTASRDESRAASVVEDVEWLLNSGTALAVIPGRVGYGNPLSLVRILRRAGREDLANIFERRGAA